MSLIELMVAMAIVGILAALAYPSYQRYVARSQRNSATACLSQYAQFMERHYTTAMTYEAAPIPPDGLPCTRESDLDERYTIAVSNIAARTYTLAATPRGVQATIDAQCGTLRLTETGERSVSGAAGRDQCWR